MPGPKQPCPRCGSRYKVPYLYQHMRSVHGVYGGATGVVREDRRSHVHEWVPPDSVPASQELVRVMSAAPEEKEWEELGEGYKLLRHRDGEFYVAQRIRFGGDR